MYRMVSLSALAAIGVLIKGTVSYAGNEVYVGVQVPREQQIAMDQVDHAAWDAILRKYVDGDGMVDYRSFKASPIDMRALDKYLATLSAADPTMRASRNGQLAFWINAYNAVTVRGILREYPTTSIRNHTARLFGYNIWKDLQLYVGSQAYSLDQIEHEVLRKMGDPRIHFAIVCASMGCPRLLNEAYTVDRVEQQLEGNSRDFFSRSQNFRHDPSSKRFYLSSILSWFAEDFGNTRAEQLRTMARWLPSEAARREAERASVEVSYLDYDWNLNGKEMSE